MGKNKLGVFIAVAALVLSIVLVGCGGKSDGKGAFDASGYQGKLDSGWSFVYLQLSDETVMISLTDADHTEDDAITYTGKATTDSSGKSTVTDEESGESIGYTLTENEDGSASVEVDGYGKGSLKAYEGNIFSVVSEMAEDDE